MSLALCHGAQTGQVAANFTWVFNVPEDTGPKDYWMTYGANWGVWWRPPVGEDVGVGGLGGRGVGLVDGGAGDGPAFPEGKEPWKDDVGVGVGGDGGGWGGCGSVL